MSSNGILSASVRFHRHTHSDSYGIPEEWHKEVTKATPELWAAWCRGQGQQSYATIDPREYDKAYTAPWSGSYPMVNTYAMGKGTYAMNPLPRQRPDLFRN